MTQVNKQLQNTIIKFHINQALKQLGITTEPSKKKVCGDDS